MTVRPGRGPKESHLTTGLTSALTPLATVKDHLSANALTVTNSDENTGQLTYGRYAVTTQEGTAVAIEPYQQQPPVAPVVDLLPFNVMPLQTPAAVVPFSQQQLVQLDTGQWVLAKVPPAAPVIVHAAPTATERRGLSRSERRALIVVGSLCALTLSVGAATAMAGPYLADAAHLAIAGAILVGSGTAAWLALRLFAPSTGRAATGQDAPTVHITNNVTVNNDGFLTRGNATGIGRIDRIG